MPWNRPSSQPTSWAWAIRSSPSLGVSSPNGSESRSSSSTSSGARPSSSSLIDDCVDLLEPLAAGLVERRRLHLLEQLADHAADPHHLRRLLDQVGDVRAPRRRPAVAAAGRRRPRSGTVPTGWPSGPTMTTRCSCRAEAVSLMALTLGGQAVSTILPMWSLVLHQPVRLGRPRSSGSVVCTTGRTGPSATSGHTCSTTEAQIAAFSSAGRARSDGGDDGAALAQQRAEVELALGAALHADDHQPALGGERVDVALEVLRAHVVEDHVGAARLASSTSTKSSSR